MQDIENFDIGDKVKHPKFGTGTIMFRTGEGDQQKLTVKFGSDVGEKKLLAGPAKLKLISERPTLAPEGAAVEAVPGRTKLAKSGDDDKDKDDDDEKDDEDSEDEDSDDGDDDDEDND